MKSSIELLRNKHKYGETYYWVLYYTFLSPKQHENVEEIIDKLSLHMKKISRKTYYRKRQEAIEIYGSVFWNSLQKIA